jgi:uncharacterized protein
MLEIYVDADGCPVKDEAYRVADRYGLTVWVVANAWLRVPDDPRVRRVMVTEGPGRADDWIAERIGPGDVAITADVPLAARCVGRGARAIAPDGRTFDEASIGAALADRNLMTALRKRVRSEAAAALSPSRTARAFSTRSTLRSRRFAGAAAERQHGQMPLEA